MDAAEVIHEKFVAKLKGGTLPRRIVGVQPDEVGLAPRGDRRAVLQPGDEPADGPALAQAAGARRGLLHDRQLGP